LETSVVWNCLRITSDTADYIFDGAYWQRHPGWLELSLGVGTVEITGWVPEGMFITLEYRIDAGAWTEIETLSGSNLNSPPYNLYTDFVPSGHGTIGVRGRVWNHSCENGYTATEEIITIP
jgi:hypothetical protein